MTNQETKIEEDVRLRIKQHKSKIETLKSQIKEEEKKLNNCETQLNCKHDWKVDISFGGPDIETCKECGVVHHC